MGISDSRPRTQLWKKTVQRFKTLPGCLKLEAFGVCRIPGKLCCRSQNYSLELRGFPLARASVKRRVAVRVHLSYWKMGGGEINNVTLEVQNCCASGDPGRGLEIERAV